MWSDVKRCQSVIQQESVSLRIHRPQSEEYFGRNHFPNVLANQTHDEDAILLQIVGREFPDSSLVLAPKLIETANLSRHVADLLVQ